jgi:2-dehydropantoate 2-reductase
MILVIGGGAVGSFLGQILGQAGEAVELLHRGRPPASLPEPPDLILVAVKMPDLEGAIATASAWPEVPVLAVENGVGADEALLAGRPAGALLAGSLTTSIERAGDGSIERLSRGGIVLAPVRGDTSGPLRRLRDAFIAGGLRARVTADPAAMRWSKLLVNLMGNASGAIVDQDPVVVYRDRDLFRIERRQLAEALAVMDALGLRPIKLFGADARFLPLAARLPGPLVQPILVRVVAGGRGGKRPSLHLHLAAGNGAQSEVEWLNGAVARAATAQGLAAPVNERLAELVEECGRDASRWAWFRGRPDRLIEAISGTRA